MNSLGLRERTLVLLAACGEEAVYARRRVELLVDGLRYGASTRIDKSLKPDARRNRKAPAE
jgi:hypothetical protein